MAEESTGERREWITGPDIPAPIRNEAYWRGASTLSGLDYLVQYESAIFNLALLDMFVGGKISKCISECREEYSNLCWNEQGDDEGEDSVLRRIRWGAGFMIYELETLRRRCGLTLDDPSGNVD